MSEIGARLDEVRTRIARAERASGRPEGSVRLVAVSKTKPIEAIREAYGHGQRVFGESYAQELVQKVDALSDLADIEWHFIGHLQTNKAKYVARTARVVHAVDSVVIAKELGRRVVAAGRAPIEALVEVKLSGEPTKHGAPPEELEEVLASVEATEGLVLRGLMTMPPADDLAAAKSAFETLRALGAIHGGPSRLPELSMGMTSDLEVAVASGATMVRVGTAIFGER